MILSDLQIMQRNPRYTWYVACRKQQADRVDSNHRHAKSRDHATIGRRNIFSLRKDKGWNAVEYVETISFNSMNDHIFYSGNTLINFQTGLNQLHFL